MTDLVAVACEMPDEADRGLSALNRLQKEYLIDLADSVVVIRQPDGKVNLKQSVNLIGAGAASGGLSGALWGSLIGRIRKHDFKKRSQCPLLQTRSQVPSRDP